MENRRGYEGDRLPESETIKRRVIGIRMSLTPEGGEELGKQYEYLFGALERRGIDTRKCLFRGIDGSDEKLSRIAQFGRENIESEEFFAMSRHCIERSISGQAYDTQDPLLHAEYFNTPAVVVYDGSNLVVKGFGKDVTQRLIRSGDNLGNEFADSMTFEYELIDKSKGLADSVLAVVVIKQ